ncbi:Heat shock protein 70, partial [mine drainage metagenome]
HVTAKDKASGKSQSMDIVAPHKMSKDEIEKRMEDAKKYEEQDKNTRENIGIKNEGESLVYTAEHTLEDYKEKIKKEDAESLTKAKDELGEALKGDDMEKIKELSEKLRNSLSEIGASLYKENKEEPNPKDGEGDGTTDADFKVNK